MERSTAILHGQARSRDAAPGIPLRRGRGKGPPDARLQAALEALDQLYESFVVDNEQLSSAQEQAARKAERLLRPLWRELRRAARAARPAA